MRYQVRVADPEDYESVASILRAQATVVLELPRRLTLAVEDLSERVRDQVRNMGATVEPDYEYAADPTFL
jgi:hypothetical protein